MEAKTERGGQAFPRAITLGHFGTENGEPGMTLRDYFAAKAMVGHLSNPATTEHPAYSRESLVSECYAMADAMLKARDT